MVGQNRDNNFGTELKRLRNRAGLTVRELVEALVKQLEDGEEQHSGISKTNLSRWENGQGSPTTAVTLLLDELLHTGGTLAAIRAPGSTASPASQHWVTFKAKYEGNIWLWVAPTQPTNLLIVWGPWEHGQRVDEPKYLVTGKNSGTQNSVMSVEFDKPTAIRFGVGPAPGSPVQHIHSAWEDRRPDVTSEALLSFLKSFLQSGKNQRTMDDLAEFLGFPTPALLHRLNTFLIPRQTPTETK